jgi:hypothetical protein
VTRWKIAYTATSDAPICSGTGLSQTVEANAAHNGPVTPFDAAPETFLLLDEIESDLELASDAYDLANRLYAVLSKAQALEVVDRSAIEATVSVAQNSFEWWRINADAFGWEVVGSCERDANGSCTDAGAVSVRGPSDRHRGITVAGSPSFTLSQFYRDFARSDARGAFTGAWTGAYAAALGTAGTGVIEGAVIGALIGGSGSSIATGIGYAIQAYQDSMKK